MRHCDGFSVVAFVIVFLLYSLPPFCVKSLSNSNTQPRSRPFPIDINQSTAPRHPESPVFFGSPLNSPIDSQFHSDRGRQTLQTQRMCIVLNKTYILHNYIFNISIHLC